MYVNRFILRLGKRNVFIRKSVHVHATSGSEDHGSNKNSTKQTHFVSLLEQYKDKITFSSYLESEKVNMGYFRYYLKTLKQAKLDRTKKFEIESMSPLPMVLRYHVDNEKLLNENTEEYENEPEKQFHLPLAKSLELNNGNKTKKYVNRDTKLSVAEQEFNRSDIDQWMTNYEHFDDTKLIQSKLNKGDDCEEEDDINYDWSNYYGTPDPKQGVSSIPCGGCGALMHCSDPSIPGYLPSEIFKGRSQEEIQAMECQRCHFLKEYNIALDVSVEPEEYEKLLQSIKHVKSLVVMMVDLLDFPCSIWPGIVDIIGTQRPIIIVGNKVDLIPGDSIGYLKRIKESLMKEIKKTKLGEANIKHISLISAKSGYGVEQLISAMFKLWLYKGDVFLIGCTNVGKSSLFNVLLQSDYCKVQAADIIKRATVSRWPGTTLNLLKFPINRPSGWKIYVRSQRLKSMSRLYQLEQEIREKQLEGKSTPMPTLMSHIGRSFSDPKIHKDDISYQTFLDKPLDMGVNEKDPLYQRSKWFYDTPGVIHTDQILSYLTTEELLLTIPKQTIRPKTYYLFKGHSIFIGGLARVDFLECNEACRFTVFCSDELPITITRIENACAMYKNFIGTELFGVPVGGTERLGHWPGLKRYSDVLEFKGDGPKECCGDLVLSSVGWVAITAKKDSMCKLMAWTPHARGVHIRKPSILPFAVNLKGKRIQNTPAYQIGKMFVG